MKVIFSDQALKNLKEIRDFIALDSYERAVSFVEEILAAIERIPDNPFRFRKSIYHDQEMYRDMIYKKYTIVFKIIDHTVFKLTVFRSKYYAG